MENFNNSNMNNTGNHNCAADLKDETVAIMAFKTLAYCVVMVMCFVGNGLVLHIFYKNRAIRTTTNSFIVNMAASDLIFPVFVIPRHMAAVFEKGPNSMNIWRVHGFLGEVLCKLVPFTGDVSNSVSILTLILISVDRCNAIVWPLSTKYRITPSRCNVLIASTWIVSIALHAQYLYTFKLYNNSKEMFCIYHWASVDKMRDPRSAELSERSQKIYFVVLFILIYLIPLITITALYSLIIHELRSKKRILSEKDQPSHHRRQRRREDNRVITMLVVIVSMFAIFFAPSYITAFLNLFMYKLVSFCILKRMQFICFFMTLSTSCINPYIYFIFIRRYRKCAKDLLKKICGSRLTNAFSKIRDRRFHFPRCFLRRLSLDSNKEGDYRTRRANSSCTRSRQTELIVFTSEQDPTLQFESGV